MLLATHTHTQTHVTHGMVARHPNIRRSEYHQNIVGYFVFVSIKLVRAFIYLRESCHKHLRCIYRAVCGFSGRPNRLVSFSGMCFVNSPLPISLKPDFLLITRYKQSTITTSTLNRTPNFRISADFGWKQCVRLSIWPTNCPSLLHHLRFEYWKKKQIWESGREREGKSFIWRYKWKNLFCRIHSLRFLI